MVIEKNKKNNLLFNFENSGFLEKQFEKKKNLFLDELDCMKNSFKCGYDDVRASLSLPYDESILLESKQVCDKVKDAKNIVVVGIGGSNLGTQAVFEALYRKLSNELNKKSIYFADTVDSDSINDISEILKKKISLGEKVVLNLISKSGTTTESISNFSHLLKIVKKQPDYEKYIVLTTDEGSKLNDYGVKTGFNVLKIPKLVGGRYSVLSNVGIFPLMFIGVNVKSLMEGAKDMQKLCFKKDILKNPAIKSSFALYYHYEKGRNVNNTFLFASNLESLGKWYKQLLGESIGKEWDVNKEKKVRVGITPLVSIGSTDLHSVAQLFLGGPDDKFHVFVKTGFKKNITIKNDKMLNEVSNVMDSKSFDSVMDAIYGGTIGAFKKKKVPFYEVEMEFIDEYAIGQFIQFKMIEMMFLGKLFNINPFDQPNVEEYKSITKKLLLN